jgi:multidrug efflux system membrane fusion protein
VYVLRKDQIASIRAVTVGTMDGNTAAVQGVNAGDIVAVNGFDKLQDGIKVSVRSGQGAASPPAQGGQ